MAYDLLVRNGRIIDGSGMPSIWGDVGVSGGKIVEVEVYFGWSVPHPVPAGTHRDP